MRIAILFFGLVIASTGFAQSFRYFAGVNTGRFYDTQQALDGTHNEKAYTSQIGYGLGVELEGLALDTLIKLRIALGFHNYGGSFYNRRGALGGSIEESGSLSKNVVALEVYPLNVRIYRKLRLSAGMSVNAMLNHTLSGNKHSTIGPEQTTLALNEINNFVKPINWGANAALGYELGIGDFLIEPRYNYHIGLSNEFQLAGIKSMRHMFSISCAYSFRNN